MLTLSLIIPVYNEDRHIKACLNAIKKQTIMPDEVIVVDNNCTDKTIKIASQYPFVTIIKESKQGLIAARNSGFNKASGDILGRIDADSVISPDWVETVIKKFNEDKSLHGVTGLAHSNVLPKIFRLDNSTFGTKAYFSYVNAYFNTTIMWGACMAIRSSTWAKCHNLTHHDEKLVHEDQDISLAMASKGLRIIQDDQLRFRTNGSAYADFNKIVYYFGLLRSTKKIHSAAGSFDTAEFSKTKLTFIKTLPGKLLSSFLIIILVIVGACTTLKHKYFQNAKNS